MARDYGNGRNATIALRVTEQEKEQIKAAAANLGISASDFIRCAILSSLENKNILVWRKQQ